MRRFSISSQGMIALVLIALLSISLPLHADDENELYLWESLLPFGSEATSNKAAQAFQEFSDYFSAMDAWRENMYSAYYAKPQFNRFRTDIQSFDAEEFLDSEFQQLAFNGRWFDETMLFELKELKASETIGRIGEVDGAFSFKQGGISEDHIVLDADISIGLGTILFTEFLESLEAFNHLVEPAQIEALNTSQLKGFSADFHPANSEYDKKLLGLFNASIPRLMATLNSVSDFEAIAEKVERPSGVIATHIIHRQRIDLTGLKENFPGTYRDFKDLLESVSFKTDVYTESGHFLASIAYNADESMFSGDITISDGGFVLRDPDGTLTNQLIIPTQLNSLNYRLVNSMRIEMFGIDVQVDDLVIQAAYKKATQGEASVRSSINMQMSEPPQIDVSGAFLYILPTWLIDLLIPGTIETLIADAFEDVIRGNDGKGFLMGFTFNENQGRHLLNITSTAELPLEVMQELLKIEEDREGDEARLYRTLRLDLRDDFFDKARLYSVP